MSATRSAAAAMSAGDDRRFRRARLGPAVRRRRDRLVRLINAARFVAVVLGLAGVFWFAGRLVLESPRFRVTRVVVRGNDRLSSGEVAALVDDLQGQRLWRLDLDAWRKRLRESAWIEDAVLRRVVPGTIEIESPSACRSASAGSATVSSCSMRAVWSSTISVRSTPIWICR